MSAIEVSGLSKTIENAASRVEILRDVNFSVPRGQFLAIMGASGSGKSTLLGLVGGLGYGDCGHDRPGRNRYHAYERGRAGAFARPQDRFRIPVVSACPHVDGRREYPSPRRAERIQWAAQRACADVCWSAWAWRTGRGHYPVQLSGGEQQRVALARAFMTRPPILMADEPTGNLDSVNGRHVLDLLVELNREEKTTLVLVTHDRKLAEHADRILTLSDGRVLSDELAERAVEA